MTDRALALDDVRAGYGAGDVLRGLSLGVDRGEMVGVLGPNGCGKTTLIRVAAGTVAARAGRVTLSGANVASLSSRERARRVSVVPQDTGPVFSLTSLEAVLLGRAPWRPAFAFDGDDDVAAADAALAEVEAVHLRERDVLTLSGGERQRVLLARALCQGGDVLLCDEPTAHLDMRHQAATFRLLRDVARRGRAVVVVTHDVNLAAQACDRLVLLGAEGTVAEGTPREVVTPANLAAAFGITASVQLADDGTPFVLRHL